MNKVIVSLTVLSLLLASCGNSTSDKSNNQTEVAENNKHHHDDESEAIVLNHGEKWNVDSNMLALIRKMENGSTFEQALGTVYGVDLMQDNVDLCRERLLCGREDLRHIVEQNIVCADALRYHYRFDGSHLYDDEVVVQKKQQIFDLMFSQN